MLKIINKPVKNYEKGRNGQKPEIVVIHIGEGNRNQIYSEFLNAEKSSHYCINNDGTIWKFVEELDTAWGNGEVKNPTSKIIKSKQGINPNSYSISLENEGYADYDIDNDQYDLNAELVLEICQRWIIPIDEEHIIPHRQINANKTCPGLLDVKRVICLVKELEVQQELEKKITILQQLVIALTKLLKLIGIK